MEDVQKLFREHMTRFTIYVVEQKFVVNRGYDFFKFYKGKPNYIDTDIMAENFVLKILEWVNKKTPILAELTKYCFDENEKAEMEDIVAALSKLFSAQEHQAAGPNIIDPIIIQEDRVLKKYINQIVNLHKESILAPAIIILLKDNDIERAMGIFSECPDGMYVKIIRNDEKHEFRKIINTGAENINGFINSFAQQCFDTCSNTKHDILLNDEWAGDSIIKNYAPRLLKYRASLICDDKNSIVDNLSTCISDITYEMKNNHSLSEHDRTLLKNFLCVSKIYNVFCKDHGGKDLEDALSLAKALDNDILTACVYKYAYFFTDKTIKEQNAFLDKAYDIFVENNMADNAIYCKNNKLVRQFDTDKINVREFRDLVGEATSDVPGLVGMSHIYNNAGVAHMMSANPDGALEFFDKGLEYAKFPERLVQRLSLQSNKLITKSYYQQKIDYSEICTQMIQIFDGMVENEQLPFISARYAMNILIVAYRSERRWVKQLLEEYDIINLLSLGLKNNTIGSGQLLAQLEYLDQKLPDLDLLSQVVKPKNITPVTGRRLKFIERSGLNPFYFCTWL